LKQDHAQLARLLKKEGSPTVSNSKEDYEQQRKATVLSYVPKEDLEIFPLEKSCNDYLEKHSLYLRMLGLKDTLVITVTFKFPSYKAY
jgi:hypothetical protein